MEQKLPADQEAVYDRAMSALDRAGVPFIVAGAFAAYYYTGAWRNTKDLDLFLLPAERDRALAVLADAGFRTEVTVEHWLAKAVCGEYLIDLITGFGNWLAPVDETWITAGKPITLFGREARIIAAADLIWAKAYVAGRERYDGADIMHLIYRASDRIDWTRLIEHFDSHGHWELLLSYLHLFRFVYPDARGEVPRWVTEQLTARFQADLQAPTTPDYPFRGPMLDRYAYLVDIDQWGLPDPREGMARSRGIPVGEVETVRDEDRERFAEYTPLPDLDGSQPIESPPAA